MRRPASLSGHSNTLRKTARLERAVTGRPKILVMKLLMLGAWLAACGVGNDGSPGDSGTNTAGHITASTTWSGTQLVLIDTTIDPGVTVTVSAGTQLTVGQAASLVVAGTLEIAGTSASKVAIGPADGAPAFGGIEIERGGVLTMPYAVVTGTSVTTTATGKATIVDSQLSHAAGDLLIMNGGTIDVEYSAIGVEPPATDSSHCDLHLGGTGDVIEFQHSNASTAAYGAMFYSGMNATFTFDNWFSNQVNVDVQPGINGDFSDSYFDGAPPARHRDHDQRSGEHAAGDLYRDERRDLRRPAAVASLLLVADLLEHARLLRRRRRQQIHADHDAVVTAKRLDRARAGLEQALVAELVQRVVRGCVRPRARGDQLVPALDRTRVVAEALPAAQLHQPIAVERRDHPRLADLRGRAIAAREHLLRGVDVARSRDRTDAREGLVRSPRG